MRCSNCGAQNLDIAKRCVRCNSEFDYKKIKEYEDKENRTYRDNSIWIICGFISAIISVFILPPLFGILGIIFGFKASKLSIGWGVFLIFLNAICMIVGMVLGFTHGVNNLKF